MSKTILVIDDSSVMRASVSFTLKSAGFEILEARDGQHGLEQLEQLNGKGVRPVMILVDVNMPVMDGITFITHMKRGPNKFVPVLVLTTESEDVKKLEGKKAGASGWLVKPFKPEQLLGVVKRFTQG